MALELITNLKLITSTLTQKPTTTQLPKGYMCFGKVNGKPSIWGNYDDAVHDMIAEGSVDISEYIVQSTGNSTTKIMSQKAVTDSITTVTTLANGAKTAADNAQNSADTAQDTAESAQTAAANALKAHNDWVTNTFNVWKNSLGDVITLDVGTSANNIPQLNSDGKLADSVIPKIAITDTYTVDTLSELTTETPGAQKGDIGIVTGLSKTYILTANDNTVAANWRELATPTDAVTSVNGKKGAVTLGGQDIKTAFTVASTRSALATGETIAVSLGKIAKWYSDLTDQTSLAFVTPGVGLSSNGSQLDFRIGAGLKEFSNGTIGIHYDADSMDYDSDSGLAVLLDENRGLNIEFSTTGLGKGIGIMLNSESGALGFSEEEGLKGCLEVRHDNSLVVDDSNQLGLKFGYTVYLADTGIEVRYGDGLTDDGDGFLKADLGDGLKFSGNKIVPDITLKIATI